MAPEEVLHPLLRLGVLRTLELGIGPFVLDAEVFRSSGLEVPVSGFWVSGFWGLGFFGFRVFGGFRFLGV